MSKELVRMIRRVENLNQHQFAELIGVSRMTIAYIEAGYTPVSSKVSGLIVEAFGEERVDKISALL